MAEEAKAPVAVDPPKVAEESTRPAEAPTGSVVAEAKPTEGGDVANTGEAVEEPNPSSAKQDAAADEKPADDANADTEEKGDDTAAAAAEDTAATNGNPTPNKKGGHNRRKSTGAAAGGKGKTLKNKKSMVELRLDAKPGDMFFVAMKGYQPWPVIVADEDMLPDTLLAKRPVSAMRIDGTYREDFREGGKNAKDRRYPVMFLFTNEFSWEVNTNLQPFDLDAVKEEVEKGNTGKKSKQLWQAYEEAAKGRDLSSFKEELQQHEQAMQDDAEDKAAAQAEKAEKAEKKAKGKRKSVAAEESEDVDMEDAGDGEEAPKKKKTNKRKAEGEGDNEKPPKTPKTKLKLNNKAPKDESATKPKKESKGKKSKAKSESEEAEPAKPEEKPLTEAEQREKQEKSVLYFRHRLQKGFLARDQTPKEEEMANMNDYLKQLEEVKNLEAETIRKTKVHKVLKAILKIESIPKEDEYNFKTRCTALLTSWGKALASDESTGESSAAPATNGVKHDAKDAPAAAEKAEEQVATDAVKETNGDGDVPMTDAKDDAPAVKADAEPATESASEPAKETATETAAA